MFVFESVCSFEGAVSVKEYGVKDIRTTNGYRKQHSTSLIIREKQIKLTMKYHL
jgi:hypothetical protein